MARRTRSVMLGQTSRTVVTTALGGLLVAACSGGTTSAPKPPEPTPLASYDGTFAQVQRVSFCSRIPKQAVADAVGTPATTSHYGNGEPLPGSKELAHEYGCVFTHGDVVARSWVFIPPVTPARAASLAAEAAKAKGCRPTPAAKFGTHAAGTVCSSGTTRTVTYRGLFGDAWLSCSVTAPAASSTAADLAAKAGIWCVRVATAAASS